MAKKKKKFKEGDWRKSLEKYLKTRDDAKRKAQVLKDLENDNFKANAELFAHEFKSAKHKGELGDFFPWDLNHGHVAWTAEDGQTLRFSVGPVFVGNDDKVLKNPAITVTYQRRYPVSDFEDEQMVFSPELWRKLNKEIERKLKMYKPKKYGKPA